MKKPRRSKNATKSSKRAKVTVNSVQKTKAATKSAPAVIPSVAPVPKPTAAPVTRSKATRAHMREGIRLFAVAGRPTQAQCILVYGPKGPKMTWAQRAKAGVPAEKFQAVMAEKSKA